MQIAGTFRASHILLNHGRGKYCDFKFHYFQLSFVTERPHSFLRRISLVLKHEKILKNKHHTYSRHCDGVEHTYFNRNIGHAT
jgi:hypothetical protein